MCVCGGGACCLVAESVVTMSVGVFQCVNVVRFISLNAEHNLHFGDL